MITLETLQKDKESYNEHFKNITLKRSELMGKVRELRQKKLQLTNEIEMAKADFQETKLISEISLLTSSLKKCKLTLELIQLREDGLQKKIDAKTYSKGAISIKKAQEKLSKEEELVYCESEIEKCEKALNLYILLGDNKKVAELKQNLKKTEEELKYAREDMEIEKGRKDDRDITTVHDEDNFKTTYDAEDKGNHTKTEFADRSYEDKSTTIIQDGRKGDFGETITLSQDFQNFTNYQIKYDETLKMFTEKSSNPIINSNGQVIGESKRTEVTNLNPSDGTPYKTINAHENLETDEGVFEIETLSEGYGEEYREQRNMTINNKLSGSIENIQYLKDERGKETYTYKENGTLGQKITKTERGTTIDIYKDGQPFATYEYDENGKAIVPMGNMEQIPEDYVENSFSIAIPDYKLILHKEPDEWNMQNENINKQKAEIPNGVETVNQEVSTQTLGKETIKEQNNVIRLDSVRRMMEAQMGEREQTPENEESYELDKGA